MTELQLPIDHISFSALKTYCGNQQQFFKNYILGIWENKSSVVQLVGKGFHKAMEQYYKTKNVDMAFEVGAQYIGKVPDSEVDWGKTGNREQALKDYAAAVNAYLNEEPDFGETLGVEVSVTTDKGFEGKVLPLPIKAVADRVTKTPDGKLHIIDYKVVTAFSDPEIEDPLKIMQAMFNFLAIQAKYGAAPEDLTFLEVKKSKNKDGSSQLRPYRIVFAEQEQYKLYFLRLYADVIYEMAREDRRYLPNFGDQYTGKEAFRDYVAETINFKAPPQVSHRANLRMNVKTTEYAASEIETNETLSKEQKIKAKLQEFGISVEMKNTHTGHNVILYTMTPSRGVSMKSFDKHAADIKLALEAKSVRIQAPIPGTALVGIEVNRDEQTMLPWSDSNLQSGTLSIPLGVDVYGKPHRLNVTDAPHILIGGTTGSGKSVFMNVLIKALTSQMSPADLRLILIDPKQTEFVEHSGLKHLESEIVTEAKTAEATLRWAIKTMEERYAVLKTARVKNITEYRKSYRDMPYIAIVIDELADLLLSTEKAEEVQRIMKNGKEHDHITTSDVSESIKKSIVRLAQKARAVGIHLICATQRPSVDIIPGIMKANFPTQIAFMVSKKVDSQVILDQPGAEELLGKGDMLVSGPMFQGLQRLQGYYEREG